MPVEMDESAIEHVVIPVSGVNAKQITAYAILNKGVPAVSLYDCEWYEFVALLAIEYPVWPMPCTILQVINYSENSSYAVF